jgi:hypothetical protein
MTDPDTTFNMFMTSVAHGDRQLSLTCLQDLVSWYQSGGHRAKCPKNRSIPTGFISGMLGMLTENSPKPGVKK